MTDAGQLSLVAVTAVLLPIPIRVLVLGENLSREGVRDRRG